MAKFFAADMPHLGTIDAATLTDAAEQFGRKMCRPIAYGRNVASLPDRNTLVGVEQTGYTQHESGMVFRLKFAEPFPADGMDDPHTYLLFVVHLTAH